MSLADSFGPSAEPRSKRRIIIPVEIPSVSVVHTVKLRLIPVDHGGQSSVALAAIGQIMGANLEIKHTRRWDTTDVTEATLQAAQKPLHFSYEVQANPDSWLVAGRRKGHFHAKVCQTSSDASSHLTVYGRKTRRSHFPSPCSPSGLDTSCTRPSRSARSPTAWTRPISVPPPARVIPRCLASRRRAVCRRCTARRTIATKRT